MTAAGVVVVVYALGLLHVLAASLAGDGAGSRAEEAHKSGRRAQGPTAQWGLVRRALDAAPSPVTLRARREGARPTQAAAA